MAEKRRTIYGFINSRDVIFVCKWAHKQLNQLKRAAIMTSLSSGGGTFSGGVDNSGPAKAEVVGLVLATGPSTGRTVS